MVTVIQLTTVHARSDTRIFLKEARTIASRLPYKVVGLVGDGRGDVEEVETGILFRDVDCVGGRRLSRTLISPWLAFSLVQRIRPVIIHFHDPELIPLGIFLSMLGYKVIYDVHEDVPKQMLSKRYLPWAVRKPVAVAMSVLEWLGAKMFCGIVAATPGIAERFPAEKTMVVYNYPIVDELTVAEPIPYEERAPLFIYPGVISKIRGIEEILRALEILDKWLQIKLELAGSCDPEDYFRCLRAFPGWRLVNYHGEVTRRELAVLLSKARAGLVLHHPVPNEVDALPIKMFEYMATGLPIIASDFRPLRKIINEEGCGLVVDQSNPKAIAEAMRWMLDHPAEAEAMGRRGRQAVLRKYNWDTEAEKLIALYERVICQPRSLRE